MYKARTREWGLKKNLKVSETREIIRQAKRGEVTVPLLVRGRRIGSKMLKENLRIAKYSSGSESGDDACCVRSVSPASTQLSAPDTYRNAEAALHAICDYTNSRIGTPAWDFSGVWREIDQGPSDWLSMIFAATDGILKDRGDISYYKKLHTCFDMCSSIIDKVSLESLCSSSIAYFKLMAVGPELAAIFGRYICGLSTIKFGESHPHTRFWGNMKVMNTEEALQIGSRFTTAYFDIVATHGSPVNETSSFWHCNIARLLNKQGAFPFTEAEVVFRDTICQHEAAMKVAEPAERDAIASFLQRIRYEFAVLLIDNGRFTAAEESLRDVGNWLQEDSNGERNPVMYELWILGTARALFGLGRHLEAQPYFLFFWERVKERCVLEGNKTPANALEWVKNNTLRLDDSEYKEKAALLDLIEKESESIWDLSDMTDKITKIEDLDD